MRQKRKQDPQCVTSDRPRTRQRIAEPESRNSRQTTRGVPRELTPCGADAGVPFDPGCQNCGLTKVGQGFCPALALIHSLACMMLLSCFRSSLFAIFPVAVKGTSET